jgi:hypothetical protein
VTKDSQKSLRLFRLLILTHGGYILATAIWPLTDIVSFMEVTGYKEDIWLVKTVGSLLIAVAICLLSYLYFNAEIRPAIVLGAITAIAFICIDLYYALNDVISDIYLADAGAEIIFLAGWIAVASSTKQPRSRS